MTFSLDASKHSDLARWLATHDKSCPHADPTKQGCSGGRLTYAFTPTTLGTVTKVQCVYGAETDLTDYDW